MSNENPSWVDSLPVAITVCDINGNVIAMNTKSRKTFEKWGGEAIIGNSLMPCHSEKSQHKIMEMMLEGKMNAYTIEKNGIKKLIYQCPWFKDGIQAGLVELSLEIPLEMPHFVRK